MQPFSFTSHATTKDTVAAFTRTEGAAKDSGYPTSYLAGGTTLIDLMKLHVMTPSRLIDLTALPLKKIVEHNGHVEVGALVTNNEMAHSPLIKNNFRFISEALLSGASVQLRNLATTSGNILQKTRCSYYRDLDARCNKRNPGSGCDAIEGFNRMHAILGGSDHCIAAHPSDLCVALMASSAVIKTERPSGGREIAFENFYTLPGNTPQIENILEPGELIVSILLKKQDVYRHSTYVKVRDRSSYAFALTSAAVALELHGRTVKQVRIAMGGVGTVPWRGLKAEQILTGHALTPEKINDAAKSITASAQPKTYNTFKVALAELTLTRALQELEKSS